MEESKNHPIIKLACKCAVSSNSDYAFVIGPYIEVLMRATLHPSYFPAQYVGHLLRVARP